MQNARARRGEGEGRTRSRGWRRGQGRRDTKDGGKHGDGAWGGGWRRARGNGDGVTRRMDASADEEC
jgi:hypothetical protein